MSYRGYLLILLVGMGYAKMSYTEEVKAAQYGNASLHCNTNGQDFSWISNSGERIRAKSGKYNIFRNGTLKIEKVSPLDVGVYICRIAGNILTNILIKLVIHTETITSNVQSNVNLTCKAEVPKNQKITTAVYSFYAFSNNRKILISKNGTLTKQSQEFGQGRIRVTKNTLQINAIKKKDGGKFLCTVIWTSENYQKGHSEYFFNVEVHEESTNEPPTIQKKDEPKAEEGRVINSSRKMETNIWYLMTLMSMIVASNFVVN